MKDYHEHIYEYVRNDFFNPKISSIKFVEFLKKNKLINNKDKNGLCLDLGSGPGSGTYYIAKHFPNVNFVGIDYNKKLIKWANDFFKKKAGSKFKLKNLKIEFGDWNFPDQILKKINNNKIQTLISVHSLCTQKKFEDAAKKIIDLNPKIIVFNSLFYEGPLDVRIHINDRNSNLEEHNPDADFNIHSLDAAKEFLKTKGYKKIIFEKFNIGEKISKPKNGKRGTYTINSDFGEYTQFSGPVYLPWYFVAAIKN